jgi:predicted N-acetyltransferase YhbS
MVIRQERRKEFPELYDFVKRAFATARVSDGDEPDFVDRLRASDGYIPELALVAEENGAIIGHGMLTRARMTGTTGPQGLLLLAPLCVALEHRNRGVGAALLREGLRLARERGYTAVILVGDPAYYGRFGFKAAASFGLTHTSEDLPGQYVLACELVPGALGGQRGIVDFAL